ncbi:MAG: hypothetical protein EOO73_24315 [Myxococcales bacterium]|nr:MAG: hypothetical protein EOO73_24315 [Myxococcales bacterium]
MSQKSCSCVKAVFGSYILRVDGVALAQAAGSNGAQRPVLNDTTDLPLQNVIDIAGGPNFGCAVVADRSVYCWRTAAAGNTYGQLGNGATDTNGALYRATKVLTAAGTALTNVKAMAIADYPGASVAAPCATTVDGNLYCWGRVTWTVNNGTALNSPYAQAITTNGTIALSGVVQAATNGRDSCVIRTGSSGNEVWCWGRNTANTLGLGDTTNRQYPVKVSGVTNPSKVIVGSTTNYDMSCALEGTGVRCWGQNSFGTIGIGNTTTPIISPTPVLENATTALSQIVDISPGDGNMCSLRSNGTLWCWGSGYQNFAANYGVTNVVALGWADDPRFLTSDGVYHLGSITRAPNCGPL